MSPSNFNVREPTSKNVCLKGRFALAIKVEDGDSLVGFLEMEELLRVENEPVPCDESTTSRPVDEQQEQTQPSENISEEKKPEVEEEPISKLKVRFFFPCGNFDFMFVKDIAQNSVYVSSISGSIKYLGEF